MNDLSLASQSSYENQWLSQSRKSPKSTNAKNYHGFVAGVFSGIAKVSIGHPFDTVKVRVQTSGIAQFRGPLDCVSSTIRKEGFRALYKGATPPLLGWMAMDSVMLGSLTLYKNILSNNLFNNSDFRSSSAQKSQNLPLWGSVWLAF